MIKHCLPFCVVLIAASVCTAQIKVVDEMGATVERYEMMWHTADSGYSRWSQGTDVLNGVPNDANAVDILVRADGYASEVRRFAGDQLTDLHAGKATLSLQRGSVVQLKLNVPGGMDVPDNFLPQVYFPQFAGRVRMMWQPANLQDERNKPDFNLLNVIRLSDRLYSFRIPSHEMQFFVAFQHPSWLQFYEVGPLSSRDVKEGLLPIDVPRPATIEVAFETEGATETPLPFQDAQIDVYWSNPDSDGSFYSTTWNERINPNEPRVFSDLGPGKFTVRLRTNPREGVQDSDGMVINPGRFFASREFSVSAGSIHKERILWTPFDPTSNRGECHARLKLLTPDGRPAAGAQVKVQWFDGHYGALEIFDGRTPDDGVVQLRGISSKVVTESPFGPYSVELDGDSVGWFRLQPTTDLQEFEFRKVPRVGDRAPNIEIIELETGVAKRLSDFHGQIVVLEFWATWCGPCQPAMNKLNLLVAENADLAEKVKIIPISVDKTSKSPVEHVAQRGWTALRHFWSRPHNDGQSEAEQAFIVHGIPTAILLNRDGTIAWRGHPEAQYAEGVGLRERIEALLGEE